MTEYAYSRKLFSISRETSTSIMFSVKSSSTVFLVIVTSQAARANDLFWLIGAKSAYQG